MGSRQIQYRELQDTMQARYHYERHKQFENFLPEVNEGLNMCSKETEDLPAAPPQFPHQVGRS